LAEADGLQPCQALLFSGLPESLSVLFGIAESEDEVPVVSRDYLVSYVFKDIHPVIIPCLTRVTSPATTPGTQGLNG
jgi:hypothetical protein